MILELDECRRDTILRFDLGRRIDSNAAGEISLLIAEQRLVPEELSTDRTIDRHCNDRSKPAPLFELAASAPPEAVLGDRRDPPLDPDMFVHRRIERG